MIRARKFITIGVGLAWSISGAVTWAAAPEATPSPIASATATNQSVPDWVSQAKLPVPKIEKLANGLEVVWFVDPTLPVVDLALMIKSGNRDDAAGKTGTVQLLSSVLDRGAAGMTSQQIARAVDSLGASRYVSAEDDTITVGMHGLSEDAERLLELLGKITREPTFPDTEVKQESSRILDRWRHVADTSQSLVSLVFHRLVCASTPYSRGGFLGIQEFSRVARADVVAFHQHHFVPSNAVLMVVGRVDPASFRKLIEARFGSWQGKAPKRTIVKLAHAKLFPPKGAGVVVGRPELTQAQIRMGFQAPLISSPDHYPLLVANTILGGFFQSKLNAKIRDEMGLTYGINSIFSYSRELGAFSINTSTQNETVGKVIKRTRELFQATIKGEVTEEEVRQAREYLVGGFPIEMGTLGAVASRWLAGYIHELGPEYLNEFIPRVNAVTLAQVKAAMKKHFMGKELLIVVGGDTAEINKSLAAEKLPKFKPVRAADLL
ncbi:MAG: M16 family metallopeptidase [Bacteriovoracia bacterium]